MRECLRKHEHTSQRRACGHRWQDTAGLWHLCRSHGAETRRCYCPCGATRDPADRDQDIMRDPLYQKALVAVLEHR